jgi:hypothetical protein
MPEAAIINPKHVQKTARYPAIRASGELLLVKAESCVTLAEIIAKAVSPMDVPNCAMVLNTAPARPWVFGLKESAMIKLATVKITLKESKRVVLPKEL